MLWRDLWWNFLLACECFELMRRMQCCTDKTNDQLTSASSYHKHADAEMRISLFGRHAKSSQRGSVNIRSEIFAVRTQISWDKEKFDKKFISSQWLIKTLQLPGRELRNSVIQWPVTFYPDSTILCGNCLRRSWQMNTWRTSGRSSASSITTRRARNCPQTLVGVYFLFVLFAALWSSTWEVSQFLGSWYCTKCFL